MTNPFVTDVEASSEQEHGIIVYAVPGGLTEGEGITVGIEIQRAPDDGSGNPDTGNASIIKSFPGFPHPSGGVRATRWREFKDTSMGSSDDIFHYRARHNDEGFDPGPWSDWIALRSVEIPSVYPTPFTAFNNPYQLELYGYWPLDYIKGDGSTPDVSGNDRNSGSVPGDVTSVQTPIGQGFNFPGQDDGFELLTDAEADTINDSFTWVLWFKSESTIGNIRARLLSRDSSENWSIEIDQSTAFPQDLNIVSGGRLNITESLVFDVRRSNIIKQDTWHFLVFQLDETRDMWRIFLGTKGEEDLQYVWQDSLGSLSGASRPVGLATNVEASVQNSDGFIGEISEVRVYDGFLSERQLLDLFHRPGDPRQTVGRLEAASDRFIDLTASGVDPFIKHPNFEILGDGTGTIAGWNIDTGEISKGNTVLSSTNEQLRFGSGVTGPQTGVGIFLGLDGADYEFRAGDPAGDNIHWDGSTLTIDGTLNATTGEIGGWTINATDLTSGNVTLDAGAEQIRLGSATAPQTGVGIFLGLDGADYEFRAGDPAGDNIHWDGSTLSVSGTITADAGTIGGWTLSSDDLTSGSVTISSANEQILLGAATAPLSGIGIFLGLSGGDYEFRAGDPNDKHIHWTGSDLILTGLVVDETNIFDRSIQMRHRFVGSHDNLVANPGFEEDSSDLTGWSDNTGSSGGVFGTDTSVDVRSGDVAADYDPTGQTADARLDNTELFSAPIDGIAVSQGDEVYVEFHHKRKAANPANDVQIGFRFVDSAGTFVSSDYSLASTPTDSYQKVSHSATVPAGAAFAVISIIVQNDGQSEINVFDDVLARRKVVGDFIVDGTIEATHVAADTLTANEIAALDMTAKTLIADTGSIGGWTLSGDEILSSNIEISSANERIVVGTATSPHTGDGIFMGVVGASTFEFSCRDEATGDEVHWDGSTLFVDGITMRDGFTGQIDGGSALTRGVMEWWEILFEDTGGSEVGSITPIETTSLKGLQFWNQTGAFDFHLHLAGFLRLEDTSGGQAWHIWAGSDDNLRFENQTVATDATIDFFNQDADGTENIGFQIFGVGGPGDGDFENLLIRFAQGNQEYQIGVNVGGTGTSRALNIFTEGNSEQLLLQTNGDVRFGGSPRMSVVGEQFEFEHNSDTGKDRSIFRILKDFSATWDFRHDYDNENLFIDGTDASGNLFLEISQPIFNILDSRKSTWDEGDVFSGIWFRTRDEDLGQAGTPDIQAKIEILHTRSGTGHSDPDAGIAFYTTNPNSSPAKVLELMHNSAIRMFAGGTEAIRMRSNGEFIASEGVSLGPVGSGITNPATGSNQFFLEMVASSDDPNVSVGAGENFGFIYTLNPGGGAEVWVMDGDANTTQISPHDDEGFWYMKHHAPMRHQEDKYGIIHVERWINRVTQVINTLCDRAGIDGVERDQYFEKIARPV